jgi:hypothetical protein
MENVLIQNLMFGVVVIKLRHAIYVLVEMAPLGVTAIATGQAGVVLRFQIYQIHALQMKSILAPVTVLGLMEHVLSLKPMLTAECTKLHHALNVLVGMVRVGVMENATGLMETALKV